MRNGKLYQLTFQHDLMELVKIYEERGEQWHRIKDRFKAAVIQQWFLMGVSDNELELLIEHINKMSDEEYFADLLKYSGSEKTN